MRRSRRSFIRHGCGDRRGGQRETHVKTCFACFAEVNPVPFSVFFYTCYYYLSLLTTPACEVVADLILDMQRIGHPAFAHLNKEQVQERAAELPENGVPPEVLRIIKEDLGADDGPMDSKLQPQKAATPCDAPQSNLAVAGAAFAKQRPHAVVAEGRGQLDAHEAEKAMLENMAVELKLHDGPKGLETFEVRTGNQLIDQFQPCYWAEAFCFNLVYGTAEPDVINTAKSKADGAQLSRRKKGNKQAPEVGIRSWAGAMQRQVASQFRRDWSFGPVLCNYVFRTNINQQANAYPFSTRGPDGKGRRMLTPDEIHQGIMEVYKTLNTGTYLDINNEKKAINGDLSKLRFAPNLSAAARKMLDNLEARTRKQPGTHEIRSIMRHQTHANRVAFGTSVFVTFSPSERDTTIMIRMARTRQNDPAIANDPCKEFYGRDKPQLDIDFCRLSVEALAQAPGCVLLGESSTAGPSCHDRSLFHVFKLPHVLSCCFPE